MLPALRRASTNGAWNQSPSCVVAIATVGEVPVSPAVLDVSGATFFCARRPSNCTVALAVLTGPPVTITSPGSRLESASSADRTAAAVAL